MIINILSIHIITLFLQRVVIGNRDQKANMVPTQLTEVHVTERHLQQARQQRAENKHILRIQTDERRENEKDHLGDVPRR